MKWARPIMLKGISQEKIANYNNCNSQFFIPINKAQVYLRYMCVMRYVIMCVTRYVIMCVLNVHDPLNKVTTSNGVFLRFNEGFLTSRRFPRSPFQRRP